MPLRSEPVTAPQPHARSLPSAALGLDLRAGPWLSPLARALLRGEHRELLAPLVLQSEAAAESPPARTGAGRSELARALEANNLALSHPAAREMAQRLALPETRVVVTGQQPGLFGGPLYALSKALAAVSWVERFERAGQPAVAVFWIATEDHDYREVSRARWLGGDGALIDLELPEDPRPLCPVGARPLGAEVASLLERAAETAGGGSHSEWTRTVARSYDAEATFGDAFARLMIALLGERCPLLLDAQDPTLKQLQGTWLELFIERREAVESTLRSAERRIEAAGFELQVRPQPGTSPLFVIEDDERRRVHWQGDQRFSLRGQETEREVAELRALAREHPKRISPGVLARPIIQDAVLGTALQVLGPGELAYMAQLAPLYSLLGVDAPRTSLRPQVALIDPRQQAQLHDLADCGIDLPTLLGREADLEAALAASQECEFAAEAERDVLARLDALRVPTCALEPQLESAWSKTRLQVEKALELFRGKVKAAAARRDQVLHRRARTLRQALLPGGELQERALCCLYFADRFGPGLAQGLLAQLDLDPSRLHVITLPGDRGVAVEETGQDSRA